MPKYTETLVLFEEASNERKQTHFMKMKINTKA